MIGTIVQLVGVILLGVGLGVEIVTHAHIGHILITLGATIFAVGTKIRHRGG